MEVDWERERYMISRSAGSGCARHSTQKHKAKSHILRNRREMIDKRWTPHPKTGKGWLHTHDVKWREGKGRGGDTGSRNMECESAHKVGKDERAQIAARSLGEGNREERVNQ
jgi:hypothetical protein